MMKLLHDEQYMSNFKPQYKLPGFWLEKLSDSDNIILSPKEIQVLNRQIATVFPPTANPLELETLSSHEIRSSILKTGFLPKQVYFQGNVLSEEFKEKLNIAQNFANIMSFTGNLYGVTVRRTSMRAYPSDWIITEDKDDLDFDLLQHLSLDPITPLAVLHQSADNEWYFCLAPYYFGWVRQKDIAISLDKSYILDYLEDSKYVIVTDSWLELPSQDEFLLFQMGSRLTYTAMTDSKLTLKIPARTPNGKLNWRLTQLENYTGKVSFGYLPYTISNTFNQAFKMLDEPYAWGGLRQRQPGRDCSRFIQDIFKVFGILLPRDSALQCNALPELLDLSQLNTHESRRQALNQVHPKGVLLCMPGHVMLLVGQDEGIPFAIHSLWAYSRGSNISKQDELVIVNKVVITSLNLGMGSKRGTYLERLSSIRHVVL